MENLAKIKEDIVESVEQLDEEKATELAAKALELGMEPLELLEVINEGMMKVGKLYENKDYYIADLIVAGLIFKGILEIDKMKEHFQGSNQRRVGRVVLGTVKGDIHDIGKDILKGMLEVNGFEVIDLGVDVSKELFVQKVIENRPDILALSGVLTYTVDSMKEVVDSITEAGLRDQVKIIIGANHITGETCQYVGADGFSNDAADGIKICLEWMKGKKNRE